MIAKKFGVLFLMLTAGCAGTVQVPEKLRPAANESLALVVPAKGDQIYECREAKWVFVAPEADLFDAAGKKIGRHYAAFYLIHSMEPGPEGSFSKVTSIQRVATKGGVAPAGKCSEVGAKARVPYTADYYFFTAK